MSDTEAVLTKEWQDNVQSVSDWVIAETLCTLDLQELLDGFCERVVAAGLPLSRAHMAMSTLHPMFRAQTFTWSEIGDYGGALIPHQDKPTQDWLKSPLKPVADEGLPEARHKLEGNTEWRRFPLLVELHAQGVTDYFILRTEFGERAEQWGTGNGVITTWSTSAPGGFTEDCLTALRRLGPRLAVAAKMARAEQTSANIMTAYLGGDAARRVLDGQIRRGDGEVIPSVIWYSDLRKSTTMADTMPGADFLSALNDFFECTAGAVLDGGGDVLRFIGDAVMAIFPIGKGAYTPEEACRAALAASRDAEIRLAKVNANRLADGQPELAMGLGLHVGDVMFGNIGTPERVEFSVIGPAANEVCRLEGLTKEVGRTVLVSRAFADHLDIAWESLGKHAFRGVAETRELLAPPPQ